MYKRERGREDSVLDKMVDVSDGWRENVMCYS